jgi:hypothetical protein
MCKHFLILLLVAFSCTRDYKNPYDPDRPDAIPTCPADIGAVALDKNRILLSFSQDWRRASGVVIERNRENEPFERVAEVMSGNSLLDTGLMMGSNYFYRLYSFNNNGRSGYSDVISASTRYDSTVQDSQPPVVVALLSVPAYFKNKDTVFTGKTIMLASGTASDANGILQVLVDNIDAGQETWARNIVLSIGFNNLVVKAFDASYNHNIATTSFVIYSSGEPDMVFVPAGTFEMGDRFSEGDADELPVHSVTISRSFWIGITGITCAQYAAFDSTYRNPDFLDPSMPVNYVPWMMAAWFCNWLSKQHGLDTCYDASFSCDFSKNGYRLPTEAEWEYAACGNLEGKRYPTGDTLELNAENGYGLVDLTSGLWDWCWDMYDATYYSKSPSVDPIGPENPDGLHVVRGGWQFAGVHSRIAERPNATNSYSNSGDNGIGFRVLRVYQ